MLGIIIECLAYRPLRKRPRLTVLITAIGVSLFIEYTAQHEVFGAATQPFPAAAAARTICVLGRILSRSNTWSCSSSPLCCCSGFGSSCRRPGIGLAMRARLLQ